MAVATLPIATSEIQKDITTLEKQKPPKILSIQRKDLELKTLAYTELEPYTKQVNTITRNIKVVIENPQNAGEWDSDWAFQEGTSYVIKAKTAPNILKETKKDSNQLHIEAAGHNQAAITLLGEGKIAILKKEDEKAQQLGTKTPKALVTTGDAIMVGITDKEGDLITYIVQV